MTATTKLSCAMLGSLLAGSLLIALVATPARAQAAPADVLILVDVSSSMEEPATPDSTVSRFDVVRSILPSLLSGLLSAGNRVGLVSVGGRCGMPPIFDLPLGSDSFVLQTAVQMLAPQIDSATDLTAVLMSLAERFGPAQGRARRALLLTDGWNTCPPLEPTPCDVARELWQRHSIRIDVAAWIDDPRAESQLRCIADATGGTLRSPHSLQDWQRLAPAEPLRALLICSAAPLLLLAARVLYRQAFHVWGQDARIASGCAALLVAASALALYLTLIAGQAWIGAAIAWSVLASVLLAARRPHSAAAAWRRGGNQVKPMFGWIPLLFVLAIASPAAATIDDGAAADGKCRTGAAADVARAHYLAFDLSGSVANHLAPMKAFARRYVQSCVAPGDDVRLVAFGIDRDGEARIVLSLVMDETTAQRSLEVELANLAIQRPRETRTYFRPLARLLSDLLASERKDPAILVVSDGKSDDAANDVPFTSFATRGLYAVEGARGWIVAIQGGVGLDFTGVFSGRSLPLPATGQTRELRSSSPVPGIDPCLIDPPVLADADAELHLGRSLLPHDQMLHGTLTVRLRHGCAVSRTRQLRSIALVVDGRTVELSSPTTLLIGPEPRQIELPVMLSPSDDPIREAGIRVLVESGAGARSAALDPPVVRVVAAPYWSQHGARLGAILFSLGAVSALTVGLLRMRMRRRAATPELVRIPGGPTVSIAPGTSITLGGEGSVLAVPGLVGDVELALVKYSGQPQTLTLRAADGVAMLIEGEDRGSVATYRLGERLRFILPSGPPFEICLQKGSSRGGAMLDPLAPLDLASGGHSAVDTVPPPAAGNGMLGF